MGREELARDEAIIEIKHLKKNYLTEKNTTIEVLANINLVVEKNEFICIVGASGCGKSTLLRILAGLEEATAGEVFFNGQVLSEPTKEIGMVFQNYSLLPWRNVLDNISLGPEFAGLNKAERKEIALKYLKMINMDRFAHAFPHELSGGMQQRVAIARSLANDPAVLLMDEPFGALDAQTRIIMQEELLKIWEINKKTILFVTHSVDEAVNLADKIIVMAPRPGDFKAIVDLELARPRSRADAKYAKYVGKLLAML